MADSVNRRIIQITTDDLRDLNPGQIAFENSATSPIAYYGNAGVFGGKTQDGRVSRFVGFNESPVFKRLYVNSTSVSSPDYGTIIITPDGQDESSRISTSINIGEQAGLDATGFSTGRSIHFGFKSGYQSDGITINIGPGSGESCSGTGTPNWGGAINVGPGTGKDSIGNKSVNIGCSTGDGSTGTDAVAIGTLAFLNGYGEYTNAIGYAAGNNTSATETIYVGRESGAGSISNKSIFIGTFAGDDFHQHNGTWLEPQLITGSADYQGKNIAIGWNAGFQLSGDCNTILGAGAGNYSTTHGWVLNNSIVLGTQAAANARGTDNTFIGYNVASEFDGDNNIIMGEEAAGRVKGDNNFIVGIGACLASTSTSADNNIVIGNYAAETSGAGLDLTSSIIIGDHAAAEAGYLLNSILIGSYAGFSATPAASQYIGFKSGYFATGAGNIGLGDFTAGYSTGSGNICIGIQAGHESSGSNNVFIGPTAGLNSSASDSFELRNVNNILMSGDFENKIVNIHDILTLTPTTTADAEDAGAVAGSIIYDSGNDEFWIRKSTGWSTIT